MKSKIKLFSIFFALIIVLFVSMNIKVKQVDVSKINYNIPKKMWAIIYSKNNNGTEYRHIDTPLDLKDNEVLIKVKAASLGSIDRDIMSKKVYTQSKIPCYSVSGVVVKKGDMVSSFYISDEVFAKLNIDKNGGCAEYVATSQDNIALKPQVLNHFNAASVSFNSIVSQKIIEALKLEQGDVVLVNDAMSSNGIMFVRMAKILGMKVIAIDNKKDEKYLKDLGVDSFFSKEDAVSAFKDKSIEYAVDFGSSYEDTSFLCSVMSKNGIVVHDNYSENKKLKCQVKEINMSDLKNFKNNNSESLKKIAALFQKGELKAEVFKVFQLRNFDEGKSLIMKSSTDGKIIINISGKY